jgi:mRNA-degrading endonuclease RelE of RelBE toxin-antitoxin system
MPDAFRVRSTAGFDRLVKSYRKRHKEFIQILADALTILEQDPLDHTRIHHVKKLANVKPGEGQYRLRLGRWRFRYDVADAGHSTVLWIAPRGHVSLKNGAAPTDAPPGPAARRSESR